MADVASTGGDAVQTGDHTFQMSGTGAGDLQLPENLSLTDAEFSTDGGDLVLTFPDGTEVRVEGYMDNPNPPTLTSADGAEVTGDVVSAMTGGDTGAATTVADAGSGAEAAADQPAHAGGNIADNPQVIAGTDGEPIGNVESLEGEVWAIRVDGTRERLELGDQVFQGDILESGADGKVGILLADETTFAMGSEGRMVLDEMIYDPSTQQGSVSMSVLQGVFTFVSGQVAKTDPDAMTLDTPVATIGIRGTQVGLDLRDGQNLNVTLMEELGGFVGEVVIVNDGGTSVLNTANAFTSVSDFDTAPGGFTTVTDNDVINTYADETLKHLPTRNSAGERTSANTYTQSEVNGENRDSLDFLNDFQTDAGPGLQTFDGKVTVTGEYQGLNRIVQTEVDATVTNPYIDKPVGAGEDKGSEGDANAVVDDAGGENSAPPEEPEEVNADNALDQLPSEELVAIALDPAVTSWSYSPETGTMTLTVTGDIDVSGVDGTSFVIEGDNTINTITSGSGDDTLSGTGEDDYLVGGAGNDTFIASPGGGNDTYVGGDGIDTITFANEDEDLVISLLTGAQNAQGQELGTAYEQDPTTNGIGVDTIIEIENVIGGSGNDIITGDAGDNVIRGGAGNDTIDGGEGQDTALFSGSYADSTFTVTMDGVVTVTGPDGTDTIINVENFLFDGDPNLIVGLEDTAVSVNVTDHVAVNDQVGFVVISGVPDGATLNGADENLIHDLGNGLWAVEAGSLDGLTITGAGSSAEDFTLSFSAYGGSYTESYFQGLAQNYLSSLTPQDLLTLSTDYVASIEDFAQNGGDIADFFGDGPLAGLMPDALSTGFVDIDVVAVVDPFTISIGGVELTEDGANGITFAGSEDQEVPLNIDIDLSDNDGSEVVSITISGLPTAEVHQVTTQVPVLDEFGAPVLGEDDEPLFEEVTSWEPEVDGNGNPVGAHLVYTDASGNDVVVYPDDTGNYTLSGEQLNNVRLVGSPDDSGTFNLQFTAVVSDDGESTATVMGSASVTLEPVADVPTVTGGASTTLEDQPVTINFDIDKEDISEHITGVVLTGIPDGSKLAIEYTNGDGETFMVNLPVVNGSANIPVGFLGEDMSTDNLVLTPPANLSGSFDLQLQVTSTELNNGDTATNYFDMPLTITAVADELGVTINGTSVVDGGSVGINAFEDGAFSLDISALTEDTDGSEVLSVTISGVPAGAILSAGTLLSSSEDGTTTWTLTPEEYADLSITPPVNSDVAFDLTVEVTNVDNNESTSTLTATVAVSLEAIADAAELLVSDVTGVEDFAIPLDISSSLTDTDGSESLSITISGMPAGSILSAGTDNGDGTWTLTPDQLDGLSITPGLHISGVFDLTVTATTTEAANGDTAVVTQQIGLTVLPDPDAPQVYVTSALGNEDTAIALNIASSLVDQDGSETLSVTIAGVPNGAILSAGNNLGNGVWEVDPADLAGLTITPPLNSNEDFTLTVTATATESDGQIAETTVDLPVTLLGVADAPELVTEGVAGLEGAPIALTIVPTLTDTDGSETLSITISNIPDGAFLLSGGDVIGISDGVATLTPDQLADLAILPPAGSLEDFDLLVTATSTENDNDISANGQGVSSVSGTLSVVVQEVANPPALMLFNGQGNEDIAVPLNIGAILTDTSGSETLSVTVSGLPEGAVLNKGTLNDDGSWTLEAGDLIGLTVDTPDNYSGQFSLDVTAVSTTADGTTAETSGSMTVSVAGVADAANLDLSDISSAEGALIPLDVHIDASLTDTDGSETLTISIDNIPEGAVLYSGVTDLLDTGALSALTPLNIVDGAVTLTADQLAGLVMVPPAGLDSDFSLMVTATTTEADAALTGNNQGIATVSGIINVDMAAVAEVPTLILQNAAGLEDGAIPLDISAMVADASETLSITIAGVPAGAMLSAGSNNNDGTWTLTPAQLAGLTITPPADSNEDFQLEITATSTEQDGTFATSSGTLSVGVTGVADAPTLTVGNLSGLEDVGLPLNISAGLTDTDGSETLSITISGLPEGASLSVGHNNGDGSWSLTGDQLDGLTLVPPANMSGNFTLTVTATSTENDGDSASVTGLMNIDLGAVADIPSLILHDAAGFEDDAIPLEISAAATGGDEIVGVTITGVPLGATLSAGTDNGFGVWTVDPADLNGLTITPPLNSNTNFQLGVTVTSMDGSDMAEVTQALNVSVTAVADKPLLNVPSQITVDGILDAADLNIEAALGDLDGSESLSVSISNIPAGAVVSLGNTVLQAVGGVIDGLQPGQLAGLQITPPPGFEGNFTIQVTATATDTDPDNVIPNGLETSISVGFIDVVVEKTIDLPDAPDLNLENALGYEDSAIPLDIDAALTDPSETLSLTISGVPAGAVLSAGTDLGNGVWSLLPEETQGLTITPPADSNVDFNLTVVATSTTDDGGVATTAGTIAVDVIGVADQPNLTLNSLTGTEDTALPLNIVSSLNDTDGSETLSINIAGLPDGALLSAGTQNDDGSWTLSAEQLTGLTLTPPLDFSGAIELTVTATAIENDGDTSSVSGVLDIDFGGIAEVPTLVLQNAAGYEDNAIPLDISALVTDASDTLSITIDGMPTGAVLSAGTQNQDGSWTLTPAQLDGLSVTPPADSNVDFQLQVTATAIDGSSTASTSGTISVGVTGVADQPNLNVGIGVGEVVGNEGFRDIPEFNHAISNVVMYVKGEDGNIDKIKIDDFSNGSEEIHDVNDLDLIGFLNDNYPGAELVAITVKAGNNGGLFGPGEGQLFLLDPATLVNSLPLLAHADQTYDFNASMTDYIGGTVGELATVFPLDIASSLNDVDGSETLSITVTDLPLGVTLSAGTQNQDGSWTLTPEQLDGLSISVPMGIDPDFDFNVTATATENDGDTASVSATVGIDGDTTADAPDLEVSAAQGDEDTAIALDIEAVLTDTDGSETLSITIGNVPNGAELSAGINNGDGTWTLTPEDLAELTITPPADSDVDFTLSVTATSREISSGDTATTTAALAVTVNAVADAPSVAAGDADGEVGQTVLLDLTSMLSDTDGSESLSITVAGFPAGASLNAGILNGDGSYTLTAADLDGLAISLPDGSSADFDLTVTATATEAANLDQASSVVTAVVNVDPLAGDDRNVVEIGEVTSGNVLTGEGDSIDPSAAADTGTDTGNSIVDVTFGGVTKSFANPNDVASDEHGTYIEIAGEHGSLKMYEDGSYDYQAEAGEPVSHLAGLTGTASASAVQDAWSGVQTFAFDSGTSFVDGSGKLDPSLADAQVSFNSNGIGVAGGEAGAGPGEQINYSEDSNQTEALGINLGGETTSVTLTVSNMFRDEEGGEQGAWQAFDADGNLVGQGVLNASTVDYGNSNNVGTATIDVGGASFQYIVFTATPTGNDGNNNDSSDFFVRALQFETNAAPSGEDVFGYTMQDADGDTASATLTIDVAQGQDVTASDPTLGVQDATGLEDAPITLDIAAALTDIDGSETLSITIGGVPNGAQLSAGTDNGDGTWTVSPEQLAGLTVTPPANSNEDFDLTVTATSTEANGGDTAVTTATLSVNVTGVADAPTATAADVTGGEDQWIGLDLSGALTDTDGSETLSVTISGVPAGANLNAGTSDGNGVWTVPASSLGSLAILPPQDFSGDMDMSLSVTSTENDGDAATTTVPFSVTVTPDADAPTVNVGVAAGFEDNAIALDISAGLTDTDGSETLSITISGVPNGAQLSAGTDNGNGTWTVTAEQLSGLSVTPPHDSNEDFVLTVNATSTETNGDTATTSVAVPVSVTGVADMPSLSATLGTPTEISGTSDITITNMGQVSAGYNNSYGYYVKDANGNPTEGVVIWDNAQGDAGKTFTIEGVDPDSIGFFVIPNGDNENMLLGDNTAVHFEQDNSGNWHAVTSLGVRLNGAGDPVLFSDPSLNEGNFDYVTDNHVGGNQNWEDLVGGGDRDFNDVNVNVEYSATPGSNSVSYPLNISTNLSDTDGSETLSITIDDLPSGGTLSAGTQNPDGSWSLTPAQLAGLTLTVPQGGDDFELTITSTSTENDGDTASISTTLGATPPTGDVTASDPTLNVSDAAGLEDNAIILDIGAALTDTDGSETLSVTIAGVPNGAVLSAGQNNGDGTWTLTGAELNGLTITPPANSNEDFDLTVTATSTEFNGGATSSSSATLSVSVTGVADTPGATAGNVTGVEDQWIALNLDSSVSIDTDGSETLSVTISGVPAGAELSAGTSAGNGVWSVPASALGSLAILPAANFAGAMAMTLAVTSTENDGDAATVAVPFTVSVTPDADAPQVTVGNAAGLEDRPIALDIGAVLTDTDGSETLSITISGVPNGAVLSNGTDNGNGTWTLSEEDLEGLTITAPHNSNEDFSLSISATATDSNGDTATTTATMNVAVTGVADAPTLSVQLGEGSVVSEGGEPVDVTIDVDSVLDTDSGFTVSARGIGSNGQLTTASPDRISFHADPQGFGVTGASSGDASEIGYKNGVSEQIVVDFDDDVSSVDVSFAWMHSAEHAKYELYQNGVKVGEGTITGITDNVDPAVTLSANGQAFDQIVFSAPGSGDDYLINSISFQTAGEGAATAVEYPLDITSSLTDTDGSETLSITVGGLPSGAALSAGTDNGNGTWTLTPAQLSGLTLTAPAGSEDFSLAVTATSTENDGDSASVSTNVFVDMPAVNADMTASSPDLSASSASGLEDSAIALNIAAALTDTDGSESLSITISGVPNGAALSAGTDNGNGTWTLTGDQLDGLSITPPSNSNDDFTLNVTATSTESNGGATASQSVALGVSVTGVADTPLLSAVVGTPVEVPGESTTPPATTVFSSNFGTRIPNSGAFVNTIDGWGTNSSAIEVWDSSTGQSGSGAYIELNDDPSNTYQDATSIDRDFPTEEGAVYTLTFKSSPRPGYDASVNKMAIKIDGQTVETVSANGKYNNDNVWTTHTVTFVGTGEPMNLEFLSTGVAISGGRGMRLDDIVLQEQLPDVVTASSTEYPLDISSSLVDTDGSETLSITIAGVPSDATLSAGTNNGNGTWTLTPAQLAGLTLTAAAGTGGFNLDISATASENDGDTATVVTTLAVAGGDTNDHIAAGADIAVADVTGLEDAAIALDIDVTQLDTDGSESMTITISGVPNGAHLSAGTDNGDGTWSLTAGDLDGLSITPAANASDDFELTVTTSTTEASNGASTVNSASFTVAVTGVADAANLSASATVHPATPDNSLVSYYEVSAGDSNLADSAGANNGTPHGVCINTHADGPSGESLVFDGHNDYVEVPHNGSMEMDSGTFVLWFNTDDADDKQALFSKDSKGYDDGGHVTAYVDDGQLMVRLQSGNNSYVVSGGSVSSGAWHQMAFSFGADGMALYLDGQLVDTDSYTGGIGNNEEPLVFGADQSQSGDLIANKLRNYFDGEMDRIGIYDRPLTPTELANLYDDGATQLTTGTGHTLVYDLDIQGSLVDLDGSENLSFQVRGLPEGVSLSAGTDNGDGTWSLTTADLDGLTMNVGASVGDDFSIEVVAITTEQDGDTAETVASLDIDVAVADPVEISGTWQNESLAGDSGDDVLYGNDGNDSLFGFGGDDILNGGTGNDSLFGDTGDDTLFGGDGDDFLSGGSGNDSMDGGTGNDSMFGGDGNDVMFGNHGNDVMDGGAGNDSMDGGTGHDTLFGGDGNDSMLGGDGNDTLYGGAGDDTLSGGSGDDTLVGGEGDDVLTGGWGSDVFKMDANSGHDIIQDIMDQDTIVFEGQQFHADDMIFNENEDGDVVISFAGVEGQSVTLNGVSMDDLDHNNDGDPSDGYSITESDHGVSVTIDPHS